MKILVTGNAGFIGGFLAPRLRALGHDVIGLDLLPCDSALHPYDSVVGDIRRPEDVRRAAAGAQVILHLAAAHRDFGISRDEFFSVNADGMRRLLEGADALGIDRFIFYSSVAVYGLSGRPTSEETAPQPVSDYGESKLAAERLLADWAHARPGRSALILRPAVVFGPRNLANMYNLMESIHRRRFIQVGRGANVKSVAYVENLVDATLFLLERLRPGLEIFNYSDYPQLTSAQIAQILAGHLGRRLPPVHLPLGPVVLAAGVFDILARLTGRNFPITGYRIQKFATATQHQSDKIRARGFEAKISLEEGFRRMVAWRLRQTAGAAVRKP